VEISTRKDTVKRTADSFQVCFLVLQFLQINNILTGERIPKKRFLGMTAKARSSFRRSISQQCAMIIKTSTKTFQLSQEIELQSSVHAVTKLHSKPYSMTTVQKLLGADGVVRVQFCNWFCKANSH
jgi:hypothetical protein